MIDSLPLSEVGIKTEAQPLTGDGISNILDSLPKAEVPVIQEEVKPEDKPAPEIEEVVPETEEEEIENDWKAVQSKTFAEEKKPEGEAVKKEEVAVDYKQKYTEVEKLLADPHIQAMIEARKAGKDIYSLINELKGVDVNSLTPQQLIIEDCKRLGITDPDAIEVEIENFNSLTPRGQAEQKNAIIAKIKAEQEVGLQKYVSLTAQSAKLTQEKEQAQQTILDSELKSLYMSKVDKEYFGIKATPEILDNTKAEIESTLGIFNSDGSYNSKALFDLAYLKANIASIMKETHKQAYTKGLKKVLVETMRPSKNETSGKPVTPGVSMNKQDSADKFARDFGGTIKSN